MPYFEIKAADFPLTIELIQVGGTGDGNVVWSCRVEMAELTAIKIPSFAALGILVRARVTYPNRVEEEQPPYILGK